MDPLALALKETLLPNPLGLTMSNRSPPLNSFVLNLNKRPSSDPLTLASKETTLIDPLSLVLKGTLPLKRTAVVSP